jgi:hypothetical protein
MSRPSLVRTYCPSAAAGKRFNPPTVLTYSG